MTTLQYILQIFQGLLTPRGERILRGLYLIRSQESPTQGNRTPVILALMVGLLILLVLAALNVDLNLFGANATHLGAAEPLVSRSQFGFVARHIMAVMVIILFLFIDGSPETLGLGIFLAFESLATAISWNWLPFDNSPFLTHFFYTMGDIFRLYFILQLARIAPKKIDGWLFFGAAISIPYALSKQYFPTDPLGFNELIRIGREVIVGSLSLLICLRTAHALRKDSIHWRLLALLVAAFASSEVLLNHSGLYLPRSIHTSESMALIRDALRNASYYLFATSAFINISTMENRIRSLSSAQTEHAIAKFRQEQKVHEAISKTTQMFAHDVRRPFSMLKAGVAMLENASTPREFREIASKLKQHVTGAMASVDAMIADIMVLGGEKKREVVDQDPAKLLLHSLRSSFPRDQRQVFALTFDLQHRSYVKGDFHQLSRALQNIIVNGIEASRSDAPVLVFTSSDQVIEGRPMVAIGITNQGSFIPVEKRDSIFEAFYTEGKKQGTGLGLAVVKKIIDSHNGKVHCSSSGNRTTFTLYLPAGSQNQGHDPALLPNDSSKLHQDLIDNPGTKRAGDHLSGVNWKTLEEPAESIKRLRDNKVHILLVEDEEVYQSALEDLLKRVKPLHNLLVVHQAKSADEIDFNRPYDLTICDLDLGPGQRDGLEILRTLTDKHPKGVYCLHTNRMGLELDKEGILPVPLLINKPMDDTELLDLFDRTLQSVAAQRTLRKELHAAKSKVVLLEDDIFLAEAFVKYMHDAAVTAFENPSRFLQVVHERPHDFRDVAAVFVDFHFDNEPELNGTIIADQLHELLPTAKLILFTDAPQFHNGTPPEPFDLVIAKELLTWEKVSKELTA